MPADYSRLLASLANSQTQKSNNALYQVVKGLIEASQLFERAFNSIGITPASGGGSGVIPVAADAVEDLDGTNNPGVLDTYSRGDHKHDYGLNSIDYDRIQAVSAASRLLGRGTAGGSNVREISVGSGLTFAGNVLSASATPTTDHVVASDGANPPSPVDDGNGNFMYIPYVP